MKLMINTIYLNELYHIKYDIKHTLIKYCIEPNVTYKSFSDLYEHLKSDLMKSIRDNISFCLNDMLKQFVNNIETIIDENERYDLIINDIKKHLDISINKIENEKNKFILLNNH